MRDVPIKDLQTARLELPIADTGAIKSIKVSVDIEHTYIGDLIVSVKPPAATAVAAVILHSREGGSNDNIKTTFDEISTPTLSAIKNKSPQGTWVLIVEDKERQDTGKIRSFTLEIGF